MKLIDLFEKMTGAVHVNDDKTLHVIASLIEKTFGPKFDKITGGCLSAQMIYSMAAAAKVDPQDLITALNKSDLSSNMAGVTLDSLYKVFDRVPIKTKKEILTFKLSVDTPDLSTAISDVKSGQPVIMIPTIELQSLIDDTEYSDDGIVDSPKHLHKRLSDQQFFHAYIIVGYDSKDDYLIIRDMRSSYGFKGYAKLSSKLLKDSPHAYKLITIVVDSVKKEPLK